MTYSGHTKENKAKSDSKKRIRRELKLQVFKHLMAHPCVDCGNSNPLVLEFDHVRGDKIKSIATLVNDCVKWQIIENEIKKCEVRCANCHRLRTVAQLGYWRQEKDGE